MENRENETLTDLERVFSPAHPAADRIFYDRKEGKYYDKSSDLYLELDDLRAFGMPV